MGSLTPPLRPALMFVLLVAVAVLGTAGSSWFLSSRGHDGFPKDLAAALPAALPMGFGAWLWLTQRSPRGVLWWKSVISTVRPVTIGSTVSVSFAPLDAPDTSWAIGVVERWNGKSSFEVLRSDSASQDGSWRVTMHSGRVGILDIRYSPRHDGEDSCTDDDGGYVTVLLPEEPRELRSFLTIVRNDLQDLVEDLQGALGAPVGMRFTGDFVGGNPYYGFYVQAEAERTGLEQFRAIFRPNGRTADWVAVDDRRIEIVSTNGPEFVRLIQSYLGFRPV